MLSETDQNNTTIQEIKGGGPDYLINPVYTNQSRPSGVNHVLTGGHALLVSPIVFVANLILFQPPYLYASGQGTTNQYFQNYKQTSLLARVTGMVVGGGALLLKDVVTMGGLLQDSKIRKSTHKKYKNLAYINNFSDILRNYTELKNYRYVNTGKRSIKLTKNTKSIYGSVYNEYMSSSIQNIISKLYPKNHKEIHDFLLDYKIYQKLGENFSKITGSLSQYFSEFIFMHSIDISKIIKELQDNHNVQFNYENDYVKDLLNNKNLRVHIDVITGYLYVASDVLGDNKYIVFNVINDEGEVMLFDTNEKKNESPNLSGISDEFANSLAILYIGYFLTTDLQNYLKDYGKKNYNYNDQNNILNELGDIFQNLLNINDEEKKKEILEKKDEYHTKIFKLLKKLYDDFKADDVIIENDYLKSLDSKFNLSGEVKISQYIEELRNIFDIFYDYFDLLIKHYDNKHLETLINTTVVTKQDLNTLKIIFEKFKKQRFETQIQFSYEGYDYFVEHSTNILKDTSLPLQEIENKYKKLVEKTINTVEKEGTKYLIIFSLYLFTDLYNIDNFPQLKEYVAGLLKNPDLADYIDKLYRSEDLPDITDNHKESVARINDAYNKFISSNNTNNRVMYGGSYDDILYGGSDELDNTYSSAVKSITSQKIKPYEVFYADTKKNLFFKIADKTPAGIELRNDLQSGSSKVHNIVKGLTAGEQGAIVEFAKQFYKAITLDSYVEKKDTSMTPAPTPSASSASASPTPSTTSASASPTTSPPPSTSGGSASGSGTTSGSEKKEIEYNKRVYLKDVLLSELLHRIHYHIENKTNLFDSEKNSIILQNLETETQERYRNYIANTNLVGGSFAIHDLLEGGATDFISPVEEKRSLTRYIFGITKQAAKFTDSEKKAFLEFIVTATFKLRNKIQEALDITDDDDIVKTFINGSPSYLDHLIGKISNLSNLNHFLKRAKSYNYVATVINDIIYSELSDNKAPKGATDDEKEQIKIRNLANLEVKLGKLQNFIKNVYSDLSTIAKIINSTNEGDVNDAKLKDYIRNIYYKNVFGTTSTDRQLAKTREVKNSLNMIFGKAQLYEKNINEIELIIDEHKGNLGEMFEKIKKYFQNNFSRKDVPPEQKTPTIFDYDLELARGTKHPRIMFNLPIDTDVGTGIGVGINSEQFAQLNKRRPVNNNFSDEDNNNLLGYYQDELHSLKTLYLNDTKLESEFNEVKNNLDEVYNNSSTIIAERYLQLSQEKYNFNDQKKINVSRQAEKIVIDNIKEIIENLYKSRESNINIQKIKEFIETYNNELSDEKINSIKEKDDALKKINKLKSYNNDICKLKNINSAYRNMIELIKNMTNKIGSDGIKNEAEKIGNLI